MKSLALTADDAAAVRKLVAPGARGLVRVTVCPLCAMPAWRATELRVPDGVCATLAEQPCDGCVDFGERHPAVFRWVTRVLQGQEFLERWTREVKET